MKAIPLLLAISLIGLPGASAQMKEVPNSGAPPVNQLSIAGNACGPAALLSAFRCGDENWRQAAAAIPGDGDRQQLRNIIVGPGMRPSQHLGGRPRWSKSGVNVADLCDMANELTRGRFLPPLEYEILFLKPRETPGRLLGRVHDRLVTSVDRGFPPILSIRRFSKKRGIWSVVEGHFVTVISIERKRGKGAKGFAVAYLDPWGGKRAEGRIEISEAAFAAAGGDPTVAPCLEAVFPRASVGRGKVGKGEPTFIAVSAVIGRW